MPIDTKPLLYFERCFANRAPLHGDDKVHHITVGLASKTLEDVLEGDTSFGAHTLAIFPTRDPSNGKRIGWAWIKTDQRPRRVAIAEIRSGDKIAYALEIERTNQEHATLVLARNDFQKMGGEELRAFLLICTMRRGWSPQDQMPEYQRKTTTHRKLVGISVLESRIWRKIEEVLNKVAK